MEDLTLTTAFCYIFILILLTSVMKKLYLQETSTISAPSIPSLPVLFFYRIILSVVKKIRYGLDYVACMFLYFLCGLCVLFDKERIFQQSFFMKKYVVFFKPETVEAILSSNVNIDKADIYHFAHPLVGTGLLTSSGKKWHYQRKLLTPTFHFQILEDFIPIFSDHSHTLNSRLRKLEKDSWIDVVPLIICCTLDIICETAMGVKINAQSGEENEFSQAFHEICAILIRRLLLPWLHPDFIFRITPTGRQFYKKIDFVHCLTRKVINQKKLEMIENNKQIKKLDQIVNDVSSNTKRRKVFLELLLEHHFKDPSFTEEDIREEVNTFMIAGHDTSAVAISWTLYLVGLHRDVQNKIQEELEEIFEGDDERKIKRNDLLRMKYLECVIKETLRLYPAVPYIARKVNENFKVLDYEVKKGTECFILPFQLHRDPESFPNPEKFDPERFFPENLTGRHPFAYVPFSAGPRNCIGQRFAIMEQKTVLSTIFRNFEVTSKEPRDKINVNASVLSRNLEPLLIRFTPRNGK